MCNSIVAIPPSLASINGIAAQTTIMTPTETITAEIKPSSLSNPTDAHTASESPKATDGLIFQAVDIIRGEVNFSGI